MARRKDEIITLKVDEALREAMAGVPNRSQFIRDAILAALESVCPLCMGTGILSPRQHEHWREFSATHALRKCPDCHEVHLTCSKAPGRG